MLIILFEVKGPLHESSSYGQGYMNVESSRVIGLFFDIGYEDPIW